MNIPAVSIIMPSFNSEKTIQAAIESVRAQTYSSWELIISDDNSVMLPTY
ncbi:glycosyltransferase [Escherichia coli]|uniref:Glycosyltransferase n=1 Tax=Escherichia coli TaxID=562 RepID=A0A6N9S7P4_ECOLX|nr:glycosyltransferase [Escherichia coli]NDR92144.1 glycosyltransferase [Escherichia coli]NDS12491.1 glycosyltransferase [Escherichia coli]NDS25775.1 glycosyltransferase [Escherichia coli]